MPMVRRRRSLRSLTRGRCRVLCAMLIAAGAAMVAIAAVTLLVLLLESDR
ncbi:MAG: hypothetical protein ACT4O0_15075 [Pseudonocardia sp.]